LQETPRVGLRWRPEFIHCIGKLGDDFMIVLDIERIFSVAPKGHGGDVPNVPRRADLETA
jgi:purine-binding chemotaxis protein CheW